MKAKKDCSEKELENLYIEPSLLNVGWEKKISKDNLLLVTLMDVLMSDLLIKLKI